MSNKDKFEKFKTLDGKEHIVALTCSINGRNFVITIDKKIFEKKDDGTYIECKTKDVDSEVLFNCTQKTKTDVIDREEL